MKLLLPALGFFVSLQAQAILKTNYDVQKFPGKVKIEADINVTHALSDALDVLFVIDNSGSMHFHQKALSNASVTIDSALSQMNRDFHLGVISTDAEGTYSKTPPGALRGYPKIITSKDMPGALAKNLIVGTDGAGVEMPFQATYLALSEPLLSGINAGFLRPEAPLALVLLTDAEDQSSIATNEFKNFLGTLKAGGSKVTVFSWIIPSHINNAGCDRDEPTRGPQKIEDLTKALNGEIYNICDMSPANIAHFAQKLAQFGLVSSPIPPSADISEVPLTIQPVVSTIEVRYGTQILTAGDLQQGWVYDSVKNAVVLGQKVPWTYQRPGTKLEVAFVPADWTK